MTRPLPNLNLVAQAVRTQLLDGRPCMVLVIDETRPMARGNTYYESIGGASGVDKGGAYQFASHAVEAALSALVEEACACEICGRHRAALQMALAAINQNAAARTEGLN